MAGEIIKTRGIVLAIHPWSRTSHVVAWLTPDHGVVSTLVKGAVRPKSAFLGQYDLFYACDLLYYAHASGELHALRETVPLKLREYLRGAWRETSLAGYATSLVRELAPPGTESASWYDFLDHFLDDLAANSGNGNDLHATDAMLRKTVELEMGLLRLAGLSPDFSELDAAAEWTPFALDRGRCGNGTRTVRITPGAVNALNRPDAQTTRHADLQDGIRFLGAFLAFHLETPPEVRRSLLQALSATMRSST